MLCNMYIYIIVDYIIIIFIVFWTMAILKCQISKDTADVSRY